MEGDASDAGGPADPEQVEQAGLIQLVPWAHGVARGVQRFAEVDRRPVAVRGERDGGGLVCISELAQVDPRDLLFVVERTRDEGRRGQVDEAVAGTTDPQREGGDLGLPEVSGVVQGEW